MTHWKLWQLDLLAPPAAPHEPAIFSPNRWFVRSLEQGKLLGVRTYSKRLERRQTRARARRKTRPLFRTGRGTWA